MFKKMSLATCGIELVTLRAEIYIPNPLGHGAHNLYVNTQLLTHVNAHVH